MKFNPLRRENITRSNSESGFTILEVVIASIVLLFVFISTLTALQTGFRLMEAARNTTLADQVIQSEIEDIRLCSWAKLEALQTADALLSPKGKLTLSSELQGQFSAIRTITNDSIRTDTVKQIKIEVTWTSYTGRVYRRNYQTIFTRYGITDYYVSNHS